MDETTIEGRSGKDPRPGKLGKLFKVLVVGGAVLAAAYASAIHGGTGTARAGTDDGGTQGW